MNIRKGIKDDIPSIMKIYEEARVFMAENGNPDQWGSSYPSRQIVEEDMDEGCLYICENDQGEISGVFYFRIGEDETYKKIYEGGWQNDEPYAVVHRIASAAKSKGTASFCLDWCFKRYPNIKIDTHENNIPMQRMLNKNGFAHCGVILTDDGTPRIAFQKI